VKKALLSLALVVFSVNMAFAATAKAGGTELPRFQHGPTADDDTFSVAEAYPVEVGGLDSDLPCSGGDISPNQRFCGVEQSTVDSDVVPGTQVGNVAAAPGILALQSTGGDGSPVRLDVNCFVSCPDGQTQPFVQSYRLIKNVPGSGKCPTTFAPRTFYQFGGGVRTWWTLIYTQPGTTFTLELTVRCLTANGQPTLHIDVWKWEVVVTFESLRRVIDVLHQGTIGTTEVPCIASEDMFAALKDSVDLIEDAINAAVPDVVTAQDELFRMEALIISFTSFVDCFDAEAVFSQAFPPSNDIQLGDNGFTGIIDTVENPCACKLLADLEALALCEGIVTP
jgi:hypothetical protein